MSPLWTLLATGLGAFALSLALSVSLRSILRRGGFVDQPNERSSHEVATPRGGGLAIVIALLAGLGFAALREQALVDAWFVAGLLGVCAVSLLDDRRSVPIYARLGIQIVAAALVLQAQGPLEAFPLPPPLRLSLSPPVAYGLGMLWFLGVVNLYNFLDGIDGYAATQAVVVGVGLLVLVEAEPVRLFAITLVAASAGFLCLNWAPAKIFMGDVGSTSLGFTCAALPYYLPGPRDVSTFQLALLLWFFLADGTFTLVCRLTRGEKVWLPHRSHLYQRLNIAGWGHSRIVLTVLPGQVLLVGALAVGPWLAGACAVAAFGGLWLLTRTVEREPEPREGGE